MVLREVGDKRIRLIRGDITEIQVEAFVYDLDTNCKLDSGYGGAINQRGGKVIQQELDRVGELPKGAAVMTSAGELKAKHIIHTNGPKYNEADTAQKLRVATLSALQLASKNGIKQLALPPIGAGLYQVPLDLCARVMMDTIVEHLNNGSTLQDIALVALDNRELRALQTVLEGGR